MSQIATQVPASQRLTHGSWQFYPATFSNPLSLVAHRFATLPACRRIRLNHKSTPIWSKLPAGALTPAISHRR